MALHLANYATTAQDEGFPDYSHLQQIQNESARAVGVEHIHAWTRQDVVRSAFYRDHPEHRYILGHRKGGGYWLWKPYIILETLKRIQPGDFLLYLDADFRFLCHPEPVMEVCRATGGFFLVELREDDRINYMWTKRDCFHYLDADTPYFHNAPHTPSGIQLYQKNDHTRQFLEEWLSGTADRRTVTDEANVCGKPNLDGFITHRHDQSVLTIVKLKHGIQGFRWPSQWGNYGKLPEYRVPGEFTQRPYDTTRYPESRYGTIFSDLIQEGYADPDGTFARRSHQRASPLARLKSVVWHLLNREK